MSIQIIPAILPKDFKELQEKLSLVAGAAEEVQVDICDGKFTPSRTWPYEGDHGEFARITHEEAGLPLWDKFDFEFDLMVANPRSVISDWVKAGASRCIIHMESVSQDDLSDIIEEWGHAVKLGLALKPKTPVSDIEPFLSKVHFVQCMGSNNIGFQGVELDESVFERVTHLRERHPDLTISVDIGVNSETIGRLTKAGANRLVAGSAIFGNANPAKAVRRLESLFS